MLQNKNVLLIGGTGSFGQKFTEIALKNYDINKLIIFSRNEYMQYEMEQKFNNGKLRFFIGDIRDKSRLDRAMENVDIVVNAAALKHVPIAEYNPIEAVKTNINGAINIIDSALDVDVDMVISLGSDKEVSPINLYGATKLVAEKLFIQANAYSSRKRTKFACVRYGNVVGSRGSVIPLFIKQREHGELTITDERMTRFWITLEQAVHFVIDSLGRMNGGEVFIPKIPSMKIMDLAGAIAPQANCRIVGIRAGEKLHEVLLTEEEAQHTIEFKDYFVVVPQFPFWTDKEMLGKKTKLCRYSSDTNKQWMTKEELANAIGGLS